MTSKECALRHYEAVKEVAAPLIATKFAEHDLRIGNQDIGHKLTLVTLKQEIAEMLLALKIKEYSIYHCLNEYVERERPDLHVFPGRYGGIGRLNPVLEKKVA